MGAREDDEQEEEEEKVRSRAHSGIATAMVGMSAGEAATALKGLKHVSSPKPKASAGGGKGKKKRVKDKKETVARLAGARTSSADSKPPREAAGLGVDESGGLIVDGAQAGGSSPLAAAVLPAGSGGHAPLVGAFDPSSRVGKGKSQGLRRKGGKKKKKKAKAGERKEGQEQ